MIGRKFQYFTAALSVLLLVLIGLQYFWIRYSIDLKEKEFDSNMQDALVDIHKELQDYYYCFKLYSKVNLNANEGIYIRRHKTDGKEFLSESIPGSVDTVMTYYWEKYGADTLYSTNKFRFRAPVDLRVELSFNYNLPRTMQETDSLGGLKEWILSSYVNSLVDEETNSRIVDTVYLDSMVNAVFQSHMIAEPVCYAVISPERKKVFHIKHDECYEKLLNSKAQIRLYNDKMFAEDYALSVDFPTRHWSILKSISGVLISSVVVTLLLITLFILLVKMMYRQKRLSEMKSDFINNMTHEFNTPVSNIKIALDTMRRRKYVNGSQRLWEIIEEENDRLESNIHLLLKTVGIEKSNGEELQLLDIKEIVEKVLKTVELKVHESGGQLITSFQGNNFQMVGNESHIINMLHNFLDNAIKYSPNQPVIILTVKDIGDFVKIIIGDKGIGINRADQERVFDKFFRVHTGMKHDVKGFGLGLAYSKTVIDNHGGSVEVKSLPGHGTEFEIKFPHKNG